MHEWDADELPGACPRCEGIDITPVGGDLVLELIEYQPREQEQR